MSRPDRKTLRVEVVYALPDEQQLLVLDVEAGTTVEGAIERSGILSRFPDLVVAPDRVGRFGTRTALDARVRDGDRIEIYRPLIADPKEIRRARAKLRGGKKSAR